LALPFVQAPKMDLRADSFVGISVVRGGA